jgi:hypothetical protein
MTRGYQWLGSSSNPVSLEDRPLPVSRQVLEPSALSSSSWSLRRCWSPISQSGRLADDLLDAAAFGRSHRRA